MKVEFTFSGSKYVCDVEINIARDTFSHYEEQQEYSYLEVFSAEVDGKKLHLEEIEEMTQYEAIMKIMEEEAWKLHANSYISDFHVEETLEIPF